MLVFGWQGETDESACNVNAHARTLIEDLRVGGLILMSRNVGTMDRTRNCIQEAQHTATAAGLPRLLIATDQEGGRIARFAPPHYPSFPSARTVGRTADCEFARQTTAAIGRTISEAGANWALMPVLDIDNNPGNQVIGDRSYGETPHIVAQMGAAAVLGMQDDSGVMACAKHFPGHGDTDVDSHHDLPIIGHDLHHLEEVELTPFRAAIEEGVGSVMTSHILFKDLDAELPASLSRNITTGLLREDMGFDGVVVTDCLEMKGVAARWGSAEAAVLAVEAGADMLLVCHTLTTQRIVRDALLAAVKAGRLPLSRLEQSGRRIARAKAMFT